MKLTSPSPNSIWQPIVAASIGQVYRARFHDGQVVLVKVPRRGIETAVERDIRLLERELVRSTASRASWNQDDPRH